MKNLKLKRDFFAGEIYPILMSVLLLIGYFGKIEVYTAALNCLIVAFALLYSNSIKPLIFFTLTFFYQITVANSPTDPKPSDNYFTGLRPYIFVFSAVVLVVCVFIFIFKNKLFTKMNFFKIPLFVPMLVLSAGFLANGLFRADYTVANLLWGLGLVLCFVLLFLLFYVSLSDSDPKELTNYFVHITMLMTWILLAEFVGCLLSGNYITASGSINRGAIVLGMGGCNEVGFHLSMLIPVNFYGFMKGKRPYLSLVSAFAVYGATLLSTSRNSMLVGSAYFFFCLILSMFVGDRKKVARIMIPCGVVAAIVGFVIFREPILAVIKHYLDRGMGDSGRFRIWKDAFKLFLENPIFGTGFYGFKVGLDGGLIVPIIPEFAHNTVFELLAATGGFGFLCYGFYRICTIKYLVHKPTLDRFMLMLGASMLAAESLLDNYVFHIFSGFYYTVALVIACLLYTRQFAPKVEVSEIIEDEATTEEEISEETDNSKFIENISEMLKESSDILNS